MRTSLWIAVTAMALSALAIASPSSYAQTPTPTPSRTSTPTATSSPEVAIPVTFLGTVSVDGASAPPLSPVPPDRRTPDAALPWTKFMSDTVAFGGRTRPYGAITVCDGT